MPPIRLSAAAFAALAFGSTACGGGAALMHPAHALPASEVSFGAGVSQNFVLGEGDEAVEEAIATRPEAVEPGEVNDYVRGSVAWSLMTPGLAPWVGGRAGLGYHLEAGVTYTGRAARVDGRYAFEGDSTALSLGLGLSARLAHPDDSATTTDIPGLNESGLHGVGVDVPIIVGWRSSAEVVQIYAGLRGGYESLFGNYLFVPSSPAEDIAEGEVTAQRWFAGGLAGLLVGVRPVWVGFELDAAYQLGSGTVTDANIPLNGGEAAPQYDGESGTLQALGLTTTGVLIGHFN